MAFKLTAAERTEKDAHANAVRAARATLDAEVERAEAVIAAAIEALNELGITPYNEAVLAARDFADTLAAARREEWDGKSEGWQAGERGQAASTFVEEWETFVGNIEDEPMAPAEDYTVNNPGDSHADDLDALPSEAET